MTVVSSRPCQMQLTSSQQSQARYSYNCACILIVFFNQTLNGHNRYIY